MSDLTGTRTFVRFFARRDLLSFFWWIAGGIALYLLTAAGVDGVYPTQADYNAAARELAGNSALIALAGPANALNTLGGQVAWQAGLFGEIIAALMSMFMIGRHTRAEEESGRDELIRSGVVGRFAPQTAAVIVVTAANLLLGAGIAVALMTYGLAGAGSIALGAGAAGAGLVFMAVALIAAQVTDSTRTMYGVTGAAIGIAYLLRAIGDVGNGVLSWLSPLGWGQQMHAFDSEVWWPILLFPAAAFCLAAVALRVANSRDIGAGVFATRPGPPRAGSFLQGEKGLAWRLQRGMMIGWAAGLLIAGLGYGSAGGDVKAVIGDSGVSKALAQGGSDLTDSFYATAILMMALIGSAFTISSVQRLRAEENAGRVENPLATALTRFCWVSSHGLVAALGSAVVVGVAGLGTGIAYAFVSNDFSQVARLLGASLTYLPAVWVLGGLSLAIFGLAPRAAMVSWLALVFCFVMMFFGPTFNFPSWLIDISPFSHVPLAPVASFDLAPMLVLTAIAGGLSTIGYLGFRRRDIDMT